MMITISSIIYLCFPNLVCFRVALDLPMSNKIAVHLPEAKAHKITGETLVNETKYSKCKFTINAAMSNTCTKLRSSIETGVAVIKHQLSIPADETERNSVIFCSYFLNHGKKRVNLRSLVNTPQSHFNCFFCV